jgi:asparagine synthase (glutamine-hydrolysing)
MCGIAGFFGGDWGGIGEAKTRARDMAAGISHRGPDGAGEWVDETFHIAMAHRRLSIIDVSSAGSQPMISKSGRYVIVFNGEIYNHNDMRAELGRREWRGHSDTETFLTGFEEWGCAETLRKTVGMFAIAVWDLKERELVLARDRIGEKPLYYGWQGHTFLFGSELKALRRHPSFTSEIDRGSLDLLLRFGYIPSPFSIYRGIRKLVPGTLIRLKAGGVSKSFPDPEPYWTLSGSVDSGYDDPFLGSDSDAVEALDSILKKSVKDQLISDVPLGAFLSGGIDSSTIVGIMQAQSSKPVKTFTIGFEEKDFNEAGYAKGVARHLGTDHTELYVTHKEARDVIGKLPEMYDEPIGDFSAIPTFLVSQLAKMHVTVALSGDGGDELFGGYERYQEELRRWKRLQSWPLFLRKATSVGLWPAIRAHNYLEVNWHTRGLPKRLSRSATLLKNRARAFAASSGAPDFRTYYEDRLSQWARTECAVDGMASSGHILPVDWNRDYHPLEAMMFYDAKTFLPDSVLAKVDRAAMAVSLETRAPFLDHRVVEFARRIPLAMKIRNGQGKWILRKVLHKYVPPELVERRKMGFGVPIGDWLKGPLREWAEELLAMRRLKDQGYLKPNLIHSRWEQHQRGTGDWANSLWSILMFQAWIDHTQLLDSEHKLIKGGRS